jgi:acyl-CoA thioester hydrolase
MSAASDDWDFPDPHVYRLRVAAEAIDAFRHVNNAVYLRWLDLAAWSHSDALGVTARLCLELDRGMVVHRAELDYLRGALESDELEIATWIVDGDRRLRCARRFQVRRVTDRETLLRARLEYVCMNLSSGRATRMPREFAAAYGPTLTAPRP